MQLDSQDFNLLALINRELKGNLLYMKYRIILKNKILYFAKRYLGYVESMEASRQRDGLKHLLHISRLGNQFVQSQQPWVLLKGTDDSK